MIKRFIENYVGLICGLGLGITMIAVRPSIVPEALLWMCIVGILLIIGSGILLGVVMLPILFVEELIAFKESEDLNHFFAGAFLMSLYVVMWVVFFS